MDYIDYSYLTRVDRKPNKWKIITVILLFAAVIIVVSGSTYLGIKTAKFENDKKKEEIRIEEERIQEQLRIEEEQRKIQEEKKRLRTANPLTEEQLQKIENIYTSEAKVAYLTFDDGPTKTVTPLILDLLKQEQIPATFFVLGNNAKINPELIKREYEEGHYIANHGYSHKYSQIYANKQNVLDEYNYTDECIRQALENPDYHSRIFRFPGGSVGGYYKSIKSEAKAFLRENQIASLDWNALSNDADGAHTKEDIMNNIISTVGEKQSVVILMHDAYDKMLTYETLPDVIQYLREKGYEFKSLYDAIELGEE